MMFNFNKEKNLKLLEERGICFEQIIVIMEEGGIIEILDHKNPDKYPNQKIYVINVEEYCYLVPFVEEESGIFLKTIIPSRKMTKYYLRGEICQKH